MKNMIEYYYNIRIDELYNKKDYYFFDISGNYYIFKPYSNSLDRSNDIYNINYGLNYFPKKEYKGITYKEGYYESLVITLGEGAGENWWCVLFPPFCMLDATETEEDQVEYDFFLFELFDYLF